MWISFLKHIEENPGIMTAIAAFGIIPLAIILYILHQIARLFLPAKTLKYLASFLGIWIAFSWLLGFMSQIIFLFSGVGGLHALVIYISMVTVIFFGLLFHQKMAFAILEEKTLKRIKNFRKGQKTI